MTCTLDGQQVNCTYTYNAGRLEGFMNPDGEPYEGNWFETPSYQPPNKAGRVVVRLSAEGNSSSGHWWHGPAEEGGEWIGTRK